MLNQQPLVKEILIGRGQRRSVNVPVGLLNLVTLKEFFLETEILEYCNLNIRKGQT